MKGMRGFFLLPSRRWLLQLLSSTFLCLCPLQRRWLVLTRTGRRANEGGSESQDRRRRQDSQEDRGAAQDQKRGDGRCRLGEPRTTGGPQVEVGQGRFERRQEGQGQGTPGRHCRQVSRYQSGRRGPPDSKRPGSLRPYPWHTCLFSTRRWPMKAAW